MSRFFKKKLVFWLLAPLYVLAFGELFVRVLLPTAVIPRYVTGAPYGVRVGMPNMRFPQTSPEIRIEVRTNSRGIRADREYSYEKPSGTCRIVLFGDSLFVGFEVNVEDSFAYLLGKRLESAGIKCEVINLAVSGFGTAEMLVALREEGVKYQPDIVVFSSHETDLDDNLRSSLYTLNDKDRLVRVNATFLPGIELSDALSKFALYRWLVENSQLYSALRERLTFYVKTWLVSLKRREEPALAAGPRSGPGQAVIPYEHRLNLRLLEEAKRVSEYHHAHFCVLEIPVNRSRTEFARKLPEYDRQTMDDLHIFSPLATFQSAADPTHKIFYEKAHGHLSPLGNRLLTDFFFAKLQETDWLKR